MFTTQVSEAEFDLLSTLVKVRRQYNAGLLTTEEFVTRITMAVCEAPIG